jgi:hypothetical protein
MKHFRIAALGLLFALYGSSHIPSSGVLSLSFEENRGQGPSNAPFLARGHGYNIVFTREGNDLLLRHAGRGLSVKTRFVDSNSKAAIRGERKQPGRVNYIRRTGSLQDIPTYGRVRYDQVYPGIDLVYYGNQQQLEYDFIVSPGADPSRILLRFDGVDDVRVDESGELVLKAADSEIVQHKPVVYQGSGSSRKDLDGSYRLTASNTVSFELGHYDRTQPLIIDPVLTYSTFLGGGNGDDDARAVALDPAGNVYVAGTTTATNFQTAFPIQANAGNQDPALGLGDAFITKLNPAGTALIYSTYFGGSGDDDANGIAVDPTGNAYIVGSTTSTDFPTSENALRRTCFTGPTGCLDAFVLGLNANGSFMVFSTYWGGTGDDEARGVAVDAGGAVYVTGRTDSPDLPTTAGAYSTDPESGGFVTKFGPGGSLFYSTYFKTIFGPADPKAIAVDVNGNTYITGGFSPPGTATGIDVFLTKLNFAGSSIVFTQTIRAPKDEFGNAVAIDAAGNAYIAGETTSLNFPTTANAVQPAYGGGPLFSSADAGSSWSVSRSGMNRTSLFALATAPGGTVFAGADDDGSGGLFKSTDGGNSWVSSATGVFDSRIHALAVDPSTPTTVYAGTRTLGLYKSTNGGTSWAATGLNNAFITSIAIDPSTPTTVYAGTDSKGVYKTENGGTSWSVLNIGLGSLTIRSLVVDPKANRTLYAATPAGVYKSINAGANWTATSTGLLDPNVNSVAVDPRTPDLIYAATNSTGIFRSTNGGSLWIAANSGLTSSSSGILASALTIDANGAVYAGIGESNSMRVYKSSNGTTWTATKLETARVTDLAVDRTNPSIVYAATVGGSDAFVVKWNSSGSLVYSTYFGGYRDDSAKAIAVDSTGGMFFAGSTSSTNFPILNPLQPTFGGGSGVVSDAFAAKLSPSGSDLVFSTYLGGSSDDFGKGIAVDASFTAYVVGVTASSDFPRLNALNPARPGLVDAFIAKIGEGSAAAYAVPARGGFTATTQGGTGAQTVGYARVQPTGFGSPSGLAIFSFRQNNILVSEAAVPASTLITTGRIFAEVGNRIDTGIAIANPNSTATTVTYFFTDASGQNGNTGSFTIPANGQIAAFLDQAPFFGGSSILGSFTFSASQSVAVIALRGFTNERNEFLITTLPVADLGVSAGTDPILFAHYADGGGWTTEIVLVNTTDSNMSGTAQFAGLQSRSYSIAPRSAVKIATPGTAPSTLAGAAQVTPSADSRTPSGVAVFSFKNAGVTVTEAGVPATRLGNAFRLYAENSGVDGQPGSIQTGIALANPTSTSALVTFELTTITGVSTGLGGSMVLPGNGQASMFLGQIQGFGGIPNPFQGVLRVSTTLPGGISVAGLRGRYNERRDFLITTTQPTNESVPNTGAEQFFPHFVDGGGYTTQFILFNGSTDQSTAGVVRFLTQSGQPLSLGVR